MPNVDLLRELEPTAARLFDRHLAATREWFPHELVPYSRGRDFEPGVAWQPGDSDCGGCIAALARGLSVKAACEVASAVAALVATGMGSDAGVVDWEQTQAFMAAHRP